MEISSAIFLFAVSTAITPGPNNAMILASGLNHGIRNSVPHLLGISIGFTLMVIVVGMGLVSVFTAAPILHQLIKVVGVCYLCYLAWLIATTPTDKLDRKQARPLSFWQAGLFQWVNPKAWVMITGAVAAFTSPSGNIHLQVLAIAAIFLVMGMPCTTLWLCGGASLKRVLRQPNHQRAFNIAMAVLLVASISPVVVELFREWIAPPSPRS